MLNTYYYYNDFIHQVIGNIYYSFLEYITTEISQRFQWKSITTYHRAIEIIKQSNNGEIQRNIKLPAITLDPTEPLQFEEKSAQWWRTPLGSNMSRRMFDPIYQDENIRVTPGFVRYTSRVNIYCWFDSIYEQIDTELRFLQVFHNVNKWSKPFGIQMFCPLPEKVYTYEYTDVNNNVHTINWTPDIVPRLLETIDKQIPMLPLYVSPMVRLTDITSSETRDKDSGEELATCAFQASFEMEFEVPTFYIVETDWSLRHMEVAMDIQNEALSDSIQNNSADYLRQLLLQQNKISNQETIDIHSDDTEVDSKYVAQIHPLMCETIPKLTLHLQDVQSAEEPDKYILSPTRAIVTQIEEGSLQVVGSYITYINSNIQKIELPENVNNFEEVMILQKGLIYTAHKVEDGNKVYIQLEEPMDNGLVYIVLYRTKN